MARPRDPGADAIVRAVRAFERELLRNRARVDALHRALTRDSLARLRKVLERVQRARI